VLHQGVDFLNKVRDAGERAESSQAMLDKALPPLAHGGVSPAQAAGDLGVALALHRPEHQFGPRHQSVGQSAGSGQTAQLGWFVGGKTQGGLGASDDQARSRIPSLILMLAIYGTPTLALVDSFAKNRASYVHGSPGKERNREEYG
jgi:hypothetical protein